MEPRFTGQLLVATPLIEDPNFFRTVVLVLRHDNDGAMGLILNRRSQEPAAPYLADWVEFLEAEGRVFLGGPVETGRAVGFGVPPDPDEPWTGMTDLSGLPGPPSPVRVFAGYSGWGPGQLDMEIAEGAWLVLAARPEDYLTTDPDGLWSRVLSRQSGRVAMLAHYPLDPSLN